jgi:RNA polymerase sigma-70 factor (ECF subfamily)
MNTSAFRQIIEVEKQAWDISEEELFITHDDIARKAAGKQIRLGVSVGLDMDDLLSAARIGMLKAFRKYQPGRYEFKNFLAFRARAAVMDLIREQNQEAKCIIADDETVDIDDPAAASYLTSQEKSPEDIVYRNERMAMAEQAISMLPEKHRAILKMHAMEEMSFQCVANELKMSISTVHRIYYQALDMARKALGLNVAETGNNDENAIYTVNTEVATKNNTTKGDTVNGNKDEIEKKNQIQVSNCDAKNITKTTCSDKREGSDGGDAGDTFDDRRCTDISWLSSAVNIDNTAQLELFADANLMSKQDKNTSDDSASEA